MNQRLIKIMAGTAAAVAIALGGVAIGRTGSGNSSAATGPGGNFQQGGFRDREGAPPSGFNGGNGGGPGFGTQVTGSTGSKIEAAIAKKYPNSQIERMFQLPDGSYVVHVFVSGGQELHVHVTKAFAIDGTDDGGGFGGPPQGGSGSGAPGGSTPPNTQTS
jgi:hypothetical protein